MVKTTEIRNKATLKCWLLQVTPSEQYCVWIAYRGVMRVVPASWSVRSSAMDDGAPGYRSILPTLRSCLVLSLAAAGKVSKSSKAEYLERLTSSALSADSYAKLDRSGTAINAAQAANVLSNNETIRFENTAESSGNFSNDLDKWNTIQLDCFRINSKRVMPS